MIGPQARGSRAADDQIAAIQEINLHAADELSGDAFLVHCD